MTNYHPETGIRFGVISMQNIDQDIASELWHGPGAVDLTWEEVRKQTRLEVEAEVQGEINEGVLDPEEEESEVEHRVERRHVSVDVVERRDPPDLPHLPHLVLLGGGRGQHAVGVGVGERHHVRALQAGRVEQLLGQHQLRHDPPILLRILEGADAGGAALETQPAVVQLLRLGQLAEIESLDALNGRSMRTTRRALHPLGQRPASSTGSPQAAHTRCADGAGNGTPGPWRITLRVESVGCTPAVSAGAARLSNAGALAHVVHLEPEVPGHRHQHSGQQQAVTSVGGAAVAAQRHLADARD